MKITAKIRNTKTKTTAALSGAWAALISVWMKALLTIAMVAVTAVIVKWIGLTIPYLAGLPATRLGTIDIAGGVVAIAGLFVARRYL